MPSTRVPALDGPGSSGSFFFRIDPGGDAAGSAGGRKGVVGRKSLLSRGGPGLAPGSSFFQRFSERVAKGGQRAKKSQKVEGQEPFPHRPGEEGEAPEALGREAGEGGEAFLFFGVPASLASPASLRLGGAAGG